MCIRDRLVTVAIIGILASIAIPQFADYKKRAFNSRAQSDMRNLITSQEAYYSDNEEYVSCGSSMECEALLPGFNASEGVEIWAEEDGDGYEASSAHCKGDKGYSFQSIWEGQSDYNKIRSSKGDFEDFCEDN